MSEPMEFGPDILTLVDEEGNEHEFEVVDSLEEGEQRYLALVPVMTEEDLEQDDGELVILRATAGEEDDEYLEPIDDEESSTVFLPSSWSVWRNSTNLRIRNLKRMTPEKAESGHESLL